MKNRRGNIGFWRHIDLALKVSMPTNSAQVALVVKNPPVNAGYIREAGSIPELGRSPGGGTATHSSILAWRIPMDKGVWQATVHWVAQSQTQLKQLSMQYAHANPATINCETLDKLFWLLIFSFSIMSWRGLRYSTKYSTMDNAWHIISTWMSITAEALVTSKILPSI